MVMAMVVVALMTVCSRASSWRGGKLISALCEGQKNNIKDGAKRQLIQASTIVNMRFE